MTIEQFQGKYRFLSNFWPAEVMLDDIMYPSVEHAYQAAKTLDPQYREQICKVLKPGDAKRLGRKFKQRPKWAEMKIDIMLNLLRQKFKHPHLAEKILATGNEELVEGNYWGDVYWGYAEEWARTISASCSCRFVRSYRMSKVSKASSKSKALLQGIKSAVYNY